jgi:hypothetical protein
MGPLTTNLSEVKNTIMEQAAEITQNSEGILTSLGTLPALLRDVEQRARTLSQE